MTNFYDPREYNPYNSRLTPECRWIGEHSPPNQQALPLVLWRELVLLAGLVLTGWYVHQRGWL